jgi:hypothetical protein
MMMQVANGSGRHQTPLDSSDDKQRKRLTKKGQSHRQVGAVKKVKDESIKVEDEFSATPFPSSSSYLHHKGSSQLGSSRCSSKSSNRHKQSKKDKKKPKSKRQGDLDSTTVRKSCGLKSKKRK